ncbi:hypothetical protein L218DRAFT_999162 [Marasmius fiardii PR-910]|nr:hypothetical protein L218DRAFT_999162 [Marasmius fiardii PR-910]
MTDKDGNIHLFRLAEVENSDPQNEDSPQDNDLSEDKKVWARYDDGSDSESNSQMGHSPGSYGGSQYTSDSEPEERTGFMYDVDPYDALDSEIDDYTHVGVLQLPDRFAAVQDSSDPEYNYESCHSESPLNRDPELHLTLDFNEYFSSKLEKIIPALQLLNLKLQSFQILGRVPNEPPLRSDA